MKTKALILLLCFTVIVTIASGGIVANAEALNGDYIKWIDNNVPYEILMSAYEYEVKYHNSTEVQFDFERSLAYLAVKNGNRFNVNRDLKALSDLVNMLKKGKTIDSFFGSNKYYLYYVEGYEAIFKEFIGEYKNEKGETVYGLKNFHPFPKGYWFNHSDDFGNARSYGFKRKHLGHDMMGSVGTPIIAVEGGTVTELGWNRYGGWRIGIRSNDKLRSYYYAHLRKNKPYIEGLKKGDTIVAGQVIGYLGVTGYSFKENSNMTGQPHLHLGMQLIFDESQYKGPKEIWVDVYAITKFLAHHRAAVYKDGVDYKNAVITKP